MWKVRDGGRCPPRPIFAQYQAPHSGRSWCSTAACSGFASSVVICYLLVPHGPRSPCTRDYAPPKRQFGHFLRPARSEVRSFPMLAHAMTCSSLTMPQSVNAGSSFARNPDLRRRREILALAGSPGQADLKNVKYLTDNMIDQRVIP